MKKTLSMLLALLTALALLAGCGAKQPAAGGAEQPPAGTQTPAVPEPAPQPGGTDGSDPQTPQAPGDGSVRVDSVEALLEAVAPGAKIVLAPGRYDLTADFLGGFPNVRDCDVWSDEHPYVGLSLAYDGAEITIRDVSGLSISGGSDDPADTEIVTEPRYAAVLNFENCTDVELACLTMGHTEEGDCSGNVLDFDACRDVRLRGMDLYGCGVYGLCAKNGSGGFAVSGSTIRDCAYGSLDISEGDGDFLFTACTFTGSGWGGGYEPNRASRLSFVDCVFGDGESTAWYFHNDVSFENCTWGEILSYPDREMTLEESYGFFPETMERLTFADALLGHGSWIGFSKVDPQSGETEYPGLMGQDWMPSLIATFDLNEDGTGSLLLGSERMDLTWERMDDDTVLCLHCPGRNLYLSLYRMHEPENAAYCCNWLMMQYDNDILWFF